MSRSKDKPSVLVIDEMHPSLLPGLQEAGFEVSYRPAAKPEEVKQLIASYQVLVVRSKMRIEDSLLALAPQLKVVARAGAGLDNIDIAAVKKRGIELIHAAEGNQQAVAEHTLGLMLNVLNHMSRADRQVRNGVWLREQNRGTELSALSVGIVGYGHMGSAVVNLLRGFGCRILIYDKYKRPIEVAGARQVELDELQTETDLLSLHVPLSPETHHWVDSRFIASFRKPIYLINTARGEITPMAALTEGLKNGKLLGIGLDVLENEKLHDLSPQERKEFSYLKTSDRVVLTPHVAGWTHQSYIKINEVLVAKLREVYRYS